MNTGSTSAAWKTSSGPRPRLRMSCPPDAERRPSLLGVIPARGGSKRLPRKNVLPLGGRPLIAWTITAALDSGVLDNVVVSTDDEEIACAARDAGAQVPW